MAVHILLLQQFPLLGSLPLEVLQRLTELVSTKSFAKREVVLQKASIPKNLCFLIEGRLQAVDFTLDGREVGLYFIDPGGYFAELAMIDDQPQPEHIIANSASTVLFVPSATIRPLLFSTPAMAGIVCRRLAERVRSQVAQRQILGVTNPLQRVCALLESLTQSQNSRIHKAPTQQEIAIMVNLTRETVTRSFQVLLAKGILAREGEDLVVDAPKLAEMASAGHLAPNAQNV